MSKLWYVHIMEYISRLEGSKLASHEKGGEILNAYDLSQASLKRLDTLISTL